MKEILFLDFWKEIDILTRQRQIKHRGAIIIGRAGLEWDGMERSLGGVKYRVPCDVNKHAENHKIWKQNTP